MLRSSSDRPNNWDAWDVEIHHLEKPTYLEFTNISVAAEGPLRATVESEIKYGKSTIKVAVSICMTILLSATLRLL